MAGKIGPHLTDSFGCTAAGVNFRNIRDGCPQGNAAWGPRWVEPEVMQVAGYVLSCATPTARKDPEGEPYDRSPDRNQAVTSKEAPSRAHSSLERGSCPAARWGRSHRRRFLRKMTRRDVA